MVEEDEIAHRGPQRRIEPAFQEGSGRLRVERHGAVVHLVAGAMLCHHARKAAWIVGQGGVAPADMAQARQVRGIGHGRDYARLRAGFRLATS